MILREIHGSTDSEIHISGHFASKSISHKILRIGYYWSFVFIDSYNFVQDYVECQKSGSKEKFYVMPLHPVLPVFFF